MEQSVVTKTGNDHKRAQTITNQHKPPTNDHKLPANHHKPPENNRKPPANDTNHQKAITNHQQTTTSYSQTTTNYQQTTTNIHTCTSNQKADVLSLLPALGNYKDHLGFEKHMQSVRGNCLLLSQYLCGTNKIGSACFGRPNS